jgi:dihydroflavonol-4-reductase
MEQNIYLLTGATTVLGNSLTRLLLEAGNKVRVLVGNGEKGVEDIPQEAEIIRGDLEDMESLETFFDVDGYDEVYVTHCASLLPAVKDNMHNALGTKNIIELCIKHGVKKLVHFSSTGAITEMELASAMAL